MPDRGCDVLIAGAGPAGMAAAVAAAEGGKRVVIVDDNPGPGGQIWRGERAGLWQNRFAAAQVEFAAQARVTSLPCPQEAVIDSTRGAERIEYGALIVCTGARERFLPFPGWTLPGVTGAGGLQALVKGGIAVRGQRVVVAGSGPLLLAVAVYLRRQGARVLMVAEQAPAAKVRGFARYLLGHPGKLIQALTLRARLLGVPYRRGTWVVSAEGDERLRAVTLESGRRLECDWLACGFGLIPNTELAALAGCRIDSGAVAIDRWQQTSVPDIYCAGEPTGVGGVESALVEGSIAGFAASGQRERAAGLFAERDEAARFRRAMEAAFALRDELSRLAEPGTIVCRCEDVTLGQVAGHRSWRSAKLQTRCGMGPCQGRICGPIVEHLLGWPASSVRPPLFPMTVERLIESGQRRQKK